MKLTQMERLILANQFRILSIIDEENREDHEINMEIIESGYVGRYSDLFTAIHAEIPEEVTRETEQILSMYRQIEEAISVVKKEDAIGLDLTKLEFRGFDGNNDPHFHYMYFLIDKEGIWEERKNGKRNSHDSSTISMYRRMLPVYHEYRNKNNGILDLEGLKQLLNVVW